MVLMEDRVRPMYSTELLLPEKWGQIPYHLRYEYLGTP